MSAIHIQKENGYAGVSFPNEGSLFMRPREAPPNPKGIICLHGRGADCLTYLPWDSIYAPGRIAWSLALEGYYVLAIDAFGAYAWGNDDAMATIDAAYAWLTGALGAGGPQIGLLGWSMGGLTALNWIRRNPEKAAAAYLCAPATNLAWFQAGQWQTEINSAYDNNFAVNSVGYNPVALAAEYQDVCPIQIVHGTVDNVIPLSQSEAFVAAVDDPDVELKTIVADHNPFPGITKLEVVEHFKSVL